MSQFENVTVVREANIYFDGKVTSRTVIFKDGTKKTLGERAEEDFRVMDRPGEPKDIAPLVAFLCSDGSSCIRGANIPCDGGMYQHVLCASHGYL